MPSATMHQLLESFGWRQLWVSSLQSLHLLSLTTPQAYTWSAKGALAIDHFSVAQHKSIRRVGNSLLPGIRGPGKYVQATSNTCCYRRSLRKRAHAPDRVASLILWAHA